MDSHDDPLVRPLPRPQGRSGGQRILSVDHAVSDLGEGPGAARYRRNASCQRRYQTTLAARAPHRSSAMRRPKTGRKRTAPGEGVTPQPACPAASPRYRRELADVRLDSRVAFFAEDGRDQPQERPAG